MTAPRPPSRFRPVKALAYLVLGVTSSAGIFILLKAVGNEPVNPLAASPASPALHAEEARRAFAALQQKVEKAGAITDQLVAEIQSAGNRWDPVWASLFPDEKESPFDLLAASLVRRRAESMAEAFAALQATVDQDMGARRYGAARHALAGFRPDSTLEEPYRALVAETLTRFDADLSAVEEHGNALADAGRYAEATKWFTQHSGRFVGTDRHGRLAMRVESLAEVARVEDARRLREYQEAQVRSDEALRKIMAPPARAPRAPSAPAGAPPALDPLRARFAERVNQGRLAQKRYSFPGGIEGSPTAASPEGLTVAGARIAWAGISRDQLFIMVGDSFHGEDWVLAAEYAFGTGTPAQGDRFLWRYLGGGDRKQRQAKIDAILANVRGLLAVPEGGFTYDPQAGWEDRVQLANRTAFDDARRLVKSMLAAGDARRREEAFEKLRAAYLLPGLAEDPREKIREAAVEALLQLRKDRIEELTKKAKATAGLGQLRTLKLELKRRREEALKVIYDPKIYLPEDDPRWKDGDKVNGQEQVDDLVGAVRELWDKPSQILLGNSRAIERDLEEIRAIGERFLPAFGLEGDPEKDLAAFEELRNNLNERLNVRSYCINAAERQDFDWNRRVDRYNDALKEKGITRDEVEHARVLNDYREMMGHRRLFLDARLCRATKKHSAVCDKAGRIWHVGSDGDPQSRARAEGFTGGVGENIALGYSSPAEIWTRGWYRASDHHRNGLRENWDCMGYGYSGSVGTENFSAIGPPKGF